ncbi:MAG TPA: hypothetical protein VNO30_36140 [Kofleriaceae bacterium]|nr:hypothetical protein [Kofleriaceae bacterium]
MQRTNRRLLPGLAAATATFAALAALAALAVGCGSGPGGGDDGDDAPDPDAGMPCESVCFRWVPDDPPPPPPGPGEPAKYVYDECNPYGLLPGVCPAGFACGGSETFQSATYSVMTPVCSPTRAAPHVLNIDLAPAPVPPGALAVSLALTLNGGAWPDGSAALERAGTFRATSQRDPLLTWTFDIPSKGQALAIALPPDTYDVQVSIDDYQGLHYPGQTRRGVLEVTAAGQHALPFDATLAQAVVRLDGAAVGTVATSHALTLQLTRVEGGSVYRTFTEGQSAAAALVLRPGTYRRTLTSQSPDDSIFPAGTVTLTGDVALPVGPAQLAIDAATILTSGSVSVDGADLPASTSSGRVTFQSGASAASAQVSSTRPASFRKRLFAGTYDVVYDTTSASLTGIPRGAVQVRSGWAAAASLAIAATTISVSGSVTLNGAALPAGTGGAVRYGSTSIPLGSAAGGGYTGRIFTGTYDVTIQGTGTQLPSFAVPVRAQWLATTAAQTWQVNAHALTVTMTHNGQTPPAAANGFERGTLTLEGVLLGQSMQTSLAPPASGALTVSTIVPDGTWTIQYGHALSSYTGTPLGYFPIGQAQVSGSAQSVTRDLRSVWVSGAVTLRGAALPGVGDPADRGSLSFAGSFYGSGGNGWLPAFAATGPAQYGTWFGPGVYDVYYYCSTAGCRSRGLPSWVVVYRALRVN